MTVAFKRSGNMMLIRRGPKPPKKPLPKRIVRKQHG